MEIELKSTITVERPTRLVDEVPQEEPHPQKVGYWYNKYECRNFPLPKARPEKWQGQDEFIAKLDAIEKPLTERYATVNRFNNAQLDKPRDQREPEMKHDGTVEGYRGSSTCRCCSNPFNGSREFNFQGWTWPEGYMHYLRDHNVLPDEGFRQFIMTYEGES